MPKDKELLWGVSDLFTEETLEEILRKASGEEDVKVSSWDFGEAGKQGDGYLSVVNRIKVEGEAGGKPVEVSLVVKSLPRNIARRKTFRSEEFFRNEIACYVDIFPKFKEFLEAKGCSYALVVPGCWAAVCDGKNDFLVLEDVNVRGFGPVTRQSSLNFSECTSILTALARFHAISFAYKDQNLEEYQAFASKLQEVYFSPRLYDWYKKFQANIFHLARDSFAKEYPGSKAEAVFANLSLREMYDRSIEYCSRTNTPSSVVTQGDCWAPNFLIKREADGTAIALALDFQLARCSSPVLDVSFCIYTCTEKLLRDEHYEDLLKIYHNELSKTISALGSDPKKLYPWDVFMKEIKEQSVHGINSALEAIPGAVLDPSEAYNLDFLQGDEPVDIGDIWYSESIKTKEGRRRIADVITHAVEMNYL
ncbi:uncharacterized protein LOC105689851 [Athalia rosae]|uniref:uncharacterized protein LOC105689851 n=1 Tax=Athalia rosae TaxID=37344 RepID=UPI0006257991|nr:uncharacterized protein LOC105689851 [Athalia rosae]